MDKTESIINDIKLKNLKVADFDFKSRADRGNKSYYYNKKTNSFIHINKLHGKIDRKLIKDLKVKEKRI